MDLATLAILAKWTKYVSGTVAFLTATLGAYLALYEAEQEEAAKAIKRAKAKFTFSLAAGAAFLSFASTYLQDEYTDARDRQKEIRADDEKRRVRYPLKDMSLGVEVYIPFRSALGKTIAKRSGLERTGPYAMAITRPKEHTVPVALCASMLPCLEVGEISREVATGADVTAIVVHERGARRSTPPGPSWRTYLAGDKYVLQTFIDQPAFMRPSESELYLNDLDGKRACLDLGFRAAGVLDARGCEAIVSLVTDDLRHTDIELVGRLSPPFRSHRSYSDDASFSGSFSPRIEPSFGIGAGMAYPAEAEKQ